MVVRNESIAGHLKPKRFEMFQNLVKKHRDQYRKDVDKSLDRIEDLMIECFIDPNTGEMFDFSPTEFGSVTKYSKAKLDPEDVLKSFSYIARSPKQVFRKKNIKKLKDYKAFLEKNVEKLYKAIDEETERLEKETYPLYVKYFKTLTKYFTNLLELDKTQVKLLHGFIDHHNNKSLVKTEMSLNKALMFAKNHKLKEYTSVSIQGDFFVFFIDRDIENNLIRSHWFLCPTKDYVDIFRKEFTITDVDGNKSVKWFEEVISGDKNAAV